MTQLLVPAGSSVERELHVVPVSASSAQAPNSIANIATMTTVVGPNGFRKNIVSSNPRSQDKADRAVGGNKLQAMCN